MKIVSGSDSVTSTHLKLLDSSVPNGSESIGIRFMRNTSCKKHSVACTYTEQHTAQAHVSNPEKVRNRQKVLFVFCFYVFTKKKTDKRAPEKGVVILLDGWCWRAAYVRHYRTLIRHLFDV